MGGSTRWGFHGRDTYLRGLVVLGEARQGRRRELARVAAVHLQEEHLCV